MGKERGKRGKNGGPTPPTRKPQPLFPPQPPTPPGQVPPRIFTHEEIIPVTNHLRFRIAPPGAGLATSTTSEPQTPDVVRVDDPQLLAIGLVDASNSPQNES